MNYRMKFLPILIGVLALSLSLSSCLKDVCDETRTFIQYDPLYAGYDQIRIDIQAESPRELKNPGKLYYYEGYLLINEISEGLHVINNEDPENPVIEAFIPIPGNVDMAVRDNILFADNYMDIVSIDISDPLNPILIDRQEDVYNGYYFQEGRGFHIGYNETEITTELECTDPNWGNGWFLQGDILFANEAFDTSGAGGGFPATVGTGGSFARFTLAKDHLYVVDQSTLYTFNVESGTPSLVSDFNVGWGVETIFPYGDNLFIGSTTGMFIYSILEPSSPMFRSQFIHANACDPVFVDGNKAYVTLRNGNNCQNFTNQLEVLDVTDIFSPKLIATHQMENPHGLSKIENKLLICEGKYGLKTFDASNDMEIRSNILNHIEDIHAYDVIALSLDHVLVIGKNGLFQYDATEDDLQLMSTIPVSRN